MGKNAVGYTRVSTSEQAENGVSLAMQKARIVSFCSAKGWHIIHIYSDDGATGKNLERPGLQQLIKDIKGDGVDVVVVLKLDRLVRSVRYLGELIDGFFDGLALASVEESLDSTSASGRMMMNLLGSLAQWEGEIISERTVASLQQKQQQGEWVGRPGFGYRVQDKHLVEEPEEQRVIRAIRQSYKNGHLSMAKLAKKYGISDATVFKIVHADKRRREWRSKVGR